MNDIYEYLAKIVYDRMEHYKRIHAAPYSTVFCDGEANAYESCYDMIQHARRGNWEALSQFDYYGEEK